MGRSRRRRRNRQPAPTETPTETAGPSNKEAFEKSWRAFAEGYSDVKLMPPKTKSLSDPRGSGPAKKAIIKRTAKFGKDKLTERGKDNLTQKG